MPTPRVGTIQHPELGTLHTPYVKSRVNTVIREWTIFLLWLLGITAAVVTYNIGACALGRFFLDHFHLWNRRIPSSASSLDKHAELLGVLLAGCLSTPLTLELILAIFKVEDISRRRGGTVEIIDSSDKAVALLIFVDWTLIPISGAIIHPRYQYVNPVSLLGVYWFGNVVLLPLSGPLACFGYLFLREKS
ncbi:hypothetical protein DL96DRAFT_1818735 [Flagelloscypha sp. PMI_526]|nr:hypothetical protein DL96DRAFT_1818735 [Flagelloscypha sp. PMI_526]